MLFLGDNGSQRHLRYHVDYSVIKKDRTHKKTRTDLICGLTRWNIDIIYNCNRQEPETELIYEWINKLIN
jgi:hypothetical protein